MFGILINFSFNTKWGVILCLFQLFWICNTDCQIDVKVDLNHKTPLILKTDSTEFFYPNADGFLRLKTSETVSFECPGTTVILYEDDTNQSHIIGECVERWMFNFRGRTLPIGQIKCKNQITHQAKYSGRYCQRNLKEIVVGFELSHGTFLTNLQICFDDQLQTTFYSKYYIQIGILGAQCCPRGNFTQGEFFDLKSTSLNDLYKRKNQRFTINSQLGLDKNDTTYIQDRNELFLSRGHLAAKGDFIYVSQQETTFHFVNVAPQWQIFNGGNWNSLEKSCRDFASKGHDLMVYSGTFGIVSLPDSKDGSLKPLFLYLEEEKRTIPVPLYYWRIVYEESTNKGIAFVGVNNPYGNLDRLSLICTSICLKIGWIPKFESKTLGFLYCCEVHDLAKAIELDFSRQIKGLLL